jgi:ethanolamine ammonia-lyase small subunit
MNDIRKDLWTDLRRLTAARIGLQRSGASLATEPLLAFQLAHARARDAVYRRLDVNQLKNDLAALGLPVLTVESAAADRQLYLMRPDLGRRLAPQADATLAPHAGHYDLACIVCDGLSAQAVQLHAASVLTKLLPLLRGFRIAPLVIVWHGRVAAGDAVAVALNADSVVTLIGERPGLSSPDSMGAYLTWKPGPNTTDADRNCISNIRSGGIGYADAALKIAHLLRAMRARGVSGVLLKDDSDALLPGGAPEKSDR